MFERPKGGERAILVQMTFPETDAEVALAEFKELAQSADAEILSVVQGHRVKPDAKYYIGTGKAEEIREQVKYFDAELVLVNHELSPSQERNLERLFQCRVVDRSGLILDIFAQRAQTFEGKLQVELAQLQHISTRLIRGWTHLERQKGGIGLRGPGETQLETDRRLLRDRIKLINKRLDKVRQNRNQNRQARRKTAMPAVSLVGYTNVGKSSLFNALTGASILVANKLFATLDPAMRKIELPGSSSIILTDTVGFIRQLPHELVDAFQATLEETRAADLLLHVIDSSDPNWKQAVEAVEAVLTDIGAQDVPLLKVFNKIDKLGDQEPHPLLKKVYDDAVWISAVTGEGLDELRLKIVEKLHGTIIEETIILQPNEAKLRAKLYAMHAVVQEKIDEDGCWELTVRMSREEREKL